MLTRWSIHLITVTLVATPFLWTQTTPPTTAKPDYSREAAVLEEMITKLSFQNDGNFTREQVSRVRVQTDAGVEHWGLLNFEYQSATQSLEIDYVRVHKPDGSTIVTPPDNIQDLDSEITRAVPFYSDLREKHVAVKGLGKGDTLEYAAHWRTSKPLAPGEFWFEYNFQREGIVLDERLEIAVPSDRSIKVKGPQSQTVHDEGSLRVYSWTASRLQNSTDHAEEEKRPVEAARGRLPSPDVMISSFRSWADVGQWYWNLQKERVEPSAAVRAKAAELTKGLSDDDAKLNALYKFVSTQYRYIGIAFGVGRYQPHAADDVLTNNYGDCKDKHTLFASLLQASGITIYPALISSSHSLDVDIPSPAQFDHIIGYLPNVKNPAWLDTTPEVTPAGFLMAQLRDKKALVMSSATESQLLTTPLDPPVAGMQDFEITGKLSDDGTFNAKVKDTMRGENEVFLREAFRRVPQPQWKDLVQQISYQLGYSGTVDEVTASVPEAVNEPFNFSYSYNRKQYPDWSNHKFTVPGHPFVLPPVHDDSKYPVWLGSAYEIVSKSRVELPKGYNPLLPSSVDLNYDFAEYHASYSQESGVLVATRRMVIKQHEVQPAEFDHYRKFIKEVSDDIDQYVFTSSSGIEAGSTQVSLLQKLIPEGASGLNVKTPDARVIAFQNHLRSLPDSTSAEANKLETDARQEIGNKDLPGAVSSLYRSVAADPKFARAWVALGGLLMAQRQTDAGLEAFHKAMAAAPEEPVIPKALGFALMAAAKYDDAIPVWQNFIKAHPEDADGPGNLGNCFRKLNRNSEAAAAYEASLKVRADQPFLRMSLASIYLQTGERQKASSAFQSLVAMDSQKQYLNDVAYEMASNDLDLPLALKYAKQAVKLAEEDSQSTTLPDLTTGDLDKIFRLAAYWDTLGWAHERMSNMDEAEQYLKASWRLTQDGVVAGHLCHLYRREHKNTAAVEMCRLAISRLSMSKQVGADQFATELAAANENLNYLTGRPVHTNNTFDSSDITIAQRTFKLPRLLPGTESAEFFLLFASDGANRKFTLQDTKFISGSEKMKPFAKQLKTIDFKVPAPAEARTRFVWRGILGCYQYSGCSFVVLDPVSVHSLN